MTTRTVDAPAVRAAAGGRRDATAAAPAVSVVIVNYQSGAWLRRCLDSLAASAGDLEFETIVIDNASPEGAPAELVSSLQGSEMILNKANLGFARACNQGIARSRGRYVLLLNPDTILRGAVLERVLEDAGNHPEAAAVGCRILTEEGTTDASCSSEPDLTGFLIGLFYLDRIWKRHPFFGRSRLTHWNYDSEREVDAVCGAFLLMRRAAIDDIGPLDERFFMYMEEIDWCRRARATGWTIRYTPAGEVVHFGAGSSRGDGSGLWTLHCQSKYTYFLKHRGLAYALAFRGLLVPWLVVRLLVWGARSVPSSPRAREARAKCAMFARALVWTLSGRS